jgi:hypothetical protein
MNAFRCSVTELSSLILVRFNFFRRNNLFTRDFNWYKFPNLSLIFFVVSLLETFSNTESTRQSRNILLFFLLSLSQYSFNMPIEIILGSKATHYYRSTRSSILSFHNSKFWPLKFPISILELISILSRTNHVLTTRIEPRFRKNPRSQPLNDK